MCYTKYGIQIFIDEKIFIFSGKNWKILLTNKFRRSIIEVQTKRRSVYVVHR